jgi:hypothetical protein
MKKQSHIFDELTVIFSQERLVAISPTQIAIIAKMTH